VRDGCGAGHGIDRDAGLAHESALKEAETDAMKRAFMTFGNPFGLALYDKEQANVVHDQDQLELQFVRRSWCRRAGSSVAFAASTAARSATCCGPPPSRKS
jgi:DNA repair and recombination protein RAD52